jgi:hypothetical protein
MTDNKTAVKIVRRISCLLLGKNAVVRSPHHTPSIPPLRFNAAIHSTETSSSLRQSGQYHGAGVFTGFGLRLWHLAQWKRLPLTAVFGRACLPVLSAFSAMFAAP